MLNVVMMNVEGPLYKLGKCTYQQEQKKKIMVQLNQRNRFPQNICRFPLPARPQWVEPAGGEERKSGGEQKSNDVKQKTVTLIYPYPKNYYHN